MNRTYQIHAHSLKKNTYYWERYEWSRSRSLEGGALELVAALAEILDLCIHPWPELSLTFSNVMAIQG